MKNMPGCYEYTTADAVAECFEGISKTMCSRLWHFVGEAERAGTAHPLGGDGSNGTVEEPVITNGKYASDMAAVWPKLTDEERDELIEAAPKNTW